MSSSSDSEYVIDVAPPPRRRAQAISAEVFKPDPNFVPPVWPKNDEERTTLCTILKNSFLFSHMDDDELSAVINAFQCIEVPRNAVLIREGEEGDCLYIVETGSFSVFKSTNEDSPLQLVNTMGPNSTVGELSLMYATPRAATVIADESGLVWKLDRETFANTVKSAALNKRSRLIDILVKIPILQNCKYPQLVQLADCSNTTLYKKGDNIVNQDAIGNAFFILLEGSADCVKNNTCVLKYKSGDYFGELALLKNVPRAASIVATSACKCIRIDVESFNRVMEPLRTTMEEKAAKYSDEPVVL